MEPSEGEGGAILFFESWDLLEHGFRSCMQNSVTAAVPDREEFCSFLPFPASAGLIFFFFFSFFFPLLCYLLSSCKFPKGWGFHYFPWEAISYQDVPTDTHLSFSLLLHTPFCFTLEGFSPPHVYTSRVICMQSDFHPCHRLLSAVNLWLFASRSNRLLGFLAA